MRPAERGGAVAPDGRDLRIGIVQARFNQPITDEIAEACVAALRELGVAPGDITRVSVPGALEIGVALAALAESDGHDALVAIGCVVRGETYHFELVANESGAAVTRVGLDHGVAIANAVLTVDNEEQAKARAVEKGRDAAHVAVEMARLLEDLA